MLKNQSIYFLLLIVLVLGCGSPKALFMSPYASDAPQIDGKLMEWQTPLERPSAQIDIRYRCSHDPQFIYLAVHVPDPYFQGQILQQGMSIWLDTTAKRNSSIGIGYPVPLTKTQEEEIAKSAEGDQVKLLDLYANAFQEFDLIGFVEEPVRASNLTSKNLKVAAGFDDLKALILELKIPAKQIYGRPLRGDEVFSLGLEVNTPPKTIDDEDNSLFNDPAQNAITGSNPMLGPGRQQQFASPGRQSTTPKLWMKVQLAAKAAE